MSSYDHYVLVTCPAAYDAGWQDGMLGVEGEDSRKWDFEDTTSYYEDGYKLGQEEAERMPEDERTKMREEFKEQLKQDEEQGVIRLGHASAMSAIKYGR